MIFPKKLKNEDEKWRWKMKRKKMKIFSSGSKISNLYFLECLNIADSKSVFRFFIYFFYQKLQSFKVALKWSNKARNGQNGPTSEGCNFWWKKDMKNLNTDLESAMFKHSKKYTFDIFNPVEKIFIFWTYLGGPIN